jgi:hypothetical protein
VFFWPMIKSKRIEMAKTLSKLGQIKTYEALVNELPYTTMAEQAHIHRDRLFTFFYVDVLQMKLRDMYKVARVLDVDVHIINNLVMEKMARDSRKHK